MPSQTEKSSSFETLFTKRSLHQTLEDQLPLQEDDNTGEPAQKRRSSPMSSEATSGQMGAIDTVVSALNTAVLTGTSPKSPPNRDSKSFHRPAKRARSNEVNSPSSDETKKPPPARGLDPGDMDILFGRGKCYASHPGNVRMQQLVKVKREEYENAEYRHDKTDIAWNMVKILQSNGARFLKKDKLQNHEWFEVPDEVARNKVSHAMRDGRVAVASSRNNDDEVRPPSGREGVSLPSALADGAETTLPSTPTLAGYPPLPWLSIHQPIFSYRDYALLSATTTSADAQLVQDMARLPPSVILSLLASPATTMNSSNTNRFLGTSAMGFDSRAPSDGAQERFGKQRGGR